MKHTIRLTTAAVLILLSCNLFSFVVAPRLAEGIWQQLGITQQDGADKIKNSFLDGYLHYEGLKAVKNIGNRGKASADLLAYTKQYLSSPVFKAAYDKMRKDSKPSEPIDYTRPKEQIRQDRIEETKKSLASTEKTISTASADMKKVMQPILDMHKKNLADYQNPNSVDFTATTHEKNGRQIFDKQEFQYKSNDWKMIYRAGKEVYDVARPFTEKWIQELP
jgi:hypothetical protein